MVVAGDGGGVAAGDGGGCVAGDGAGGGLGRAPHLHGVLPARLDGACCEPCPVQASGDEQWLCY